MKLMIAYDGSTYADAAVEDLGRAGLPNDAEVLVVSVADLSTNRPALSEFDLVSAATRRMDAVLAQAKVHDDRVLEENRQMASSVAERLRTEFPDWRVSFEILEGDPATELLTKADDWRPDLVIGGSHGRSAIGRFFLGSVSRSFAERSRTSVRIVRATDEQRKDGTIRIIVGAKSLGEGERIAEWMNAREWPIGTRVRFIGVDDGVKTDRVSAFYSDGALVYERVAERLTAQGLSVSIDILHGDPKTVLVNAAGEWGADMIVAAAGGIDGELDEAASNLITAAKGTVEIVR